MKNINKYLKCGIVLGALVYSVGTSFPTQSAYADEINTEAVVKEWRPEGKVIATGEDGVPWELYENGYLLFKPEPGKDTLSTEKKSWKTPEYGEKTKAIGFTDKVYLPEDSSGLFSNFPGSFTFAEFLDTSKIDTSKVKNMSSLFYYSKLKEINLDNWNTSNVTDMSGMFLGSSGVEKLNISNLNTKNVKSMNGMFSNLEGSGFKNLDLSKWNTSNLTDIGRMFTLNYSVENVNVSNWNTSKITTMQDSFSGAHNLKEIKGIESWNTSNVKTINNMFAFSENLKFLNLSKWDTSNVEDMSDVFSGSEGLIYLNIENWDTSKIQNFANIFSNTSLTHLKIGNKFAKTKLTDNLFKTLDEFYPSYDSNDTKKHNYKWTRLDKNTQFYTVEEWNKVFRANPDKLAGTWVREKNYNGYDITFETGTDESIEPLEVEIGKDFDLPVPTKVKEGYHFVGWSKIQDGEIIKDKTNLGKKNETITLYAKWEKNPPVSTNTPIDENNNPILPPIVNDLPEYNGGVNPTEAPVNEKPEYKGPLSTNTPVDDKGELVLPPTVNDLPEYKGSVNPTDSLVNEKPEYKGLLSTNTPVDDKGELVLPPVVDDLPEYNGGANPIDSPVNEKPEYTDTLSTNTLVLPPVVNELPEYKGGVNPADAPINEKPEYKGTLSTNTPVDENENPILPPVVEELPKYNTPVDNSTVNNEKIETTKEETKHEKERELPNTNSTSILPTLISSVIGILGLTYKKRK